MDWNRIPTLSDTELDMDQRVFEAGGFGRRGGFPQRPALLVVDVTYRFCGDRSEPILDSIERWPLSSGERAWTAMPRIRALIDAAHEGRRPVLYSKGLSGPGAAPPGFGRWGEKNLRRTEELDAGAIDPDDIVADIAPSDGDLVVSKGKPSAFFGTMMASHLITAEVDGVILCGGVTSGCVRATAVDAFSYGFKVAVVEEGCFDRGIGAHRATLFDIQQKYGDIVTTEDAAAVLRSSSSVATTEDDP